MSITAVILAAGASRRMGSPKALLELQGETYLARIVRTARAAGVPNILVVAGPPHGERVRARLPVGAAVIWNPNPDRGMFSSVQAGVAGLPRGTLSALIWPVDQPLVREDTVRRVLTAQPGRIVIPRHHGQGGHPVRIPMACFGPLLGLPAEATLKDLIDRQAALRVDVDVDDRWVVQDVDTPEEAQAAAEEVSGPGGVTPRVPPQEH
jgi:molybdenum cofactor cytidylyltransferase